MNHDAFPPFGSEFLVDDAALRGGSFADLTSPHWSPEDLAYLNLRLNPYSIGHDGPCGPIMQALGGCDCP